MLGVDLFIQTNFAIFLSLGGAISRSACGQPGVQITIEAL